MTAFSALLRTFAELEPGDAEARTAAGEMLGVFSTTAIPAAPSVGAWKPTLSEGGTSPGSSMPLPTLPADPEQPRRQPELAASAGVRSRLTVVSRGKAVLEIPDWARQPDQPLWPVVSSPVTPAVKPLFAPLRRRGILFAIVSTLVEEGEVDLERAVDQLSTGAGLRKLPRSPIATTRRGVQVLVDQGSGLDPFRDDQRQVVLALDDLLSDDRFEVRYFRGCPSRGVYAVGDESARAWRAPSPKTPILMLTDLGLGGPLFEDDVASTGEWLAFAARASEGGRAILALVPYEARRWPRALSRAMRLVHWSERTSVGEVRRALRDARRGGLA